MRQILHVIALLALISTAAQAESTYENAVVAYDRGEFTAAFDTFRALAMRGHDGAEFMLGTMYFYGKGVAKNDKFAAIWFHKAALKGNPGGQLAFGSLHIRGVGVRQDLVKAYAWLTIAANNDIPGLQQQAIALREDAADHMHQDEIREAREIADRFEPERAGQAN